MDESIVLARSFVQSIVGAFHWQFCFNSIILCKNRGQDYGVIDKTNINTRAIHVSAKNEIR